MITIRQRSGQTVILGTLGEEALVEALYLLCGQEVADGDTTRAEYLRSLIQTLEA